MTIKLTREEAIQDLEAIKSFERYARGRLALDMAIEALKREQPDEWCTDCKEYDTEKKCCPRFNKVIREAMKRIPHDDGTLEVKVEDATKVGRVLISDDEHRGGLYYPDEDEPQSVSFENDTKIKSYSKDSDLISRADAIRVVEKNSYRMAGLTELKLKIEIDALPSADRPRGEWIHTPNGIERDFVWWTCSECGHKIFSETEKDRIEFHAYCGRCGAYMRGEDE